MSSGKADSESLLKTLSQVKRNIPRPPTRGSDRAPVRNPRYDDGTDGGRGRGGRDGGRGRGGRGGGRGGGGVHMDFDEPPSASGDVAPELYLEFVAAFGACNVAYQQAAAQWNRQNMAYMAYIGVSMNLSSRK